MNATNKRLWSGRRSVLDEAVARIRAMHRADVVEREPSVRLVKRFAGIVVPRQPFCCPECGCRRYQMVCGMRECSWCRGKGRILGRAAGAP